MSLPSDDTRREEQKTPKGQSSNAETGRKPSGLAAASGIESAQKRKEATEKGGERSEEGKKRKKESGAVATASAPQGKKDKEKKEKKDPSEMSAAERRELKEQNKKRRIVAGSVVGGLVVVAGTVFVLTVDVGDMFDNFGSSGEVLEDEGGNVSGRGALEDERGQDESLSAAEEGFPVDIDEYLKTGYNSVENTSFTNAWEDEYLDPNGWQPLETEDGVIEFDDWDVEANAPSDPRRDLSPGDEGYEDAMGWIYRDNAEQEYRHGYIGDIAQNWPAREMGYTNNPDREVDDDGMPNPWYSYVLAEDVQWFFGNNLQRIINPVYGGWFYDHENPQDMDTSVFRELFTEGWWEENIEDGDASNLPIFADWNNDSYGGQEVGTYGWFGEVVDSNVEVVPDEEGYSVINATLDLEYSALSSGGDTITREAQLDIQVIPNQEDTDDINNRFLISNAQLTVED